MATAEEVVRQTIEEWKAENPEAKIRTRTLKLLDKARDDVIVKMAGFSDHWPDKWEVDHCNARASAVSDYVRRVAQETVKEWIDANIGELPQMTPDMVKALKEDFKEDYEQEMGRALTKLAQKHAMEDAEECISKFMEEQGLPELRIKLDDDIDDDGVAWW